MALILAAMKHMMPVTLAQEYHCWVEKLLVPDSSRLLLLECREVHTAAAAAGAAAGQQQCRLQMLGAHRHIIHVCRALAVVLFDLVENPHGSHCLLLHAVGSHVRCSATTA